MEIMGNLSIFGTKAQYFQRNMMGIYCTKTSEVRKY